MFSRNLSRFLSRGLGKIQSLLEKEGGISSLLSPFSQRSLSTAVSSPVVLPAPVTAVSPVPAVLPAPVEETPAVRAPAPAVEASQLVLGQKAASSLVPQTLPPYHLWHP